MCLKLLHSAWNNCSRVDKHLLLPFSRFLPSFVPSPPSPLTSLPFLMLSWHPPPALEVGAGGSRMAESHSVTGPLDAAMATWQTTNETEHPRHIHHPWLPSAPRQDGNDFCQLCSSPLPLAAPSCLLKKRKKKKEEKKEKKKERKIKERSENAILPCIRGVIPKQRC